MSHDPIISKLLFKTSLMQRHYHPDILPSLSIGVLGQFFPRTPLIVVYPTPRGDGAFLQPDDMKEMKRWMSVTLHHEAIHSLDAWLPPFSTLIVNELLEVAWMIDAIQKNEPITFNRKHWMNFFSIRDSECENTLTNDAVLEGIACHLTLKKARELDLEMQYGALLAEAIKMETLHGIGTQIVGNFVKKAIESWEDVRWDDFYWFLCSLYPPVLRDKPLPYFDKSLVLDEMLPQKDFLEHPNTFLSLITRLEKAMKNELDLGMEMKAIISRFWSLSRKAWHEVYEGVEVAYQEILAPRGIELRFVQSLIEQCERSLYHVEQKIHVGKVIAPIIDLNARFIGMMAESGDLSADLTDDTNIEVSSRLIERDVPSQDELDESALPFLEFMMFKAILDETLSISGLTKTTVRCPLLSLIQRNPLPWRISPSEILSPLCQRHFQRKSRVTTATARLNITSGKFIHDSKETCFCQQVCSKIAILISG